MTAIYLDQPMTELVQIIAETCEHLTELDEYQATNKLEQGVLTLLKSELPFEQLCQSAQVADYLLPLLRYSNDILILNLVPPRNLVWHPIDIYPDWAVILNYNIKYGGNFLSIVTRDLVVIDCDQTNLVDIKQRIEEKYPSDCFYVHQTSRKSYHLILLSRTLPYFSKESIQMKYDLECDPQYSQFSLYRGNSIRLISKIDSDSYDYPLVGCYGSMSIDDRAWRLYQLVLGEVAQYGQYHIGSFENDEKFKRMLSDRWNACQTRLKSMFYLTQIKGTIPRCFDANGLSWPWETSAFTIPEPTVPTKSNSNGNSQSSSMKDLKKYLKRKFCYLCQDAQNQELIDLSIRSMQFPWPESHPVAPGEIYSNSEYSVGVDLTQNYYFQVFRRFFYVDLDDKSRLKIVYEFARYHPTYLFWVLPTNKGYHGFLMSQYLDHGDPQSSELLSRLGCDNLFRYNCRRKGYSLRLNRKTESEKIPTWRDIQIIGQGIALPPLVKLFQLHLSLLAKYSTYPLILAPKSNASEILNAQVTGEENS